MINDKKPWLKYYPEEVRTMTIPHISLNDYLKQSTNNDAIALEYYGNSIKWNTIWNYIEQTTNALLASGIKKGDQIPVFLQAVPEYLYILLAAEKIGASIMCRDGEISENVDAVKKANASIIFVHDFFSQEEEIEMKKNGVTTFIKISPKASALRIPSYVADNLALQYKEKNTIQDGMTWEDFLALGKTAPSFHAEYDITAPLLRAYTTGTTGTSKQVIHSAQSIIGVLHQMNFYSFDAGFRFRWLLTLLPPSLVAVTVSMMLSPLASGKLLILDPFVNVYDIDLSLIDNRANGWAMIPMFVDVILKSKRLENEDLSFFMAAGAGAEFMNNKQLLRIRKFLVEHNSPCQFTTGYGMSEAGSNVTLYSKDTTGMNFCYGIPLPLTTVSICKPGTEEELDFHELGEICIQGPGVMIGYDDEEATKETLRTHADGLTWLHTGDIGYLDEDGQIYVLNRNFVKHHSGGTLFASELENKVITIKGVSDAFFVTVPDSKHEDYYLPYLYVIPKSDIDKKQLTEEIYKVLSEHEKPVEIRFLKERPFFHFKTARKILAKEILSA